jgi:SAM-dependent methyltransferase
LLGRRDNELSDELRAELADGPTWTYGWKLRDGTTTPVHRDFLVALYEASAASIEGPVREALAAAGPDASALDIGCNEGWFSQRLLDWGAGRVLGCDSREFNVRRARLMRDHYGIPAERLALDVADLFDLSPARVGRFDVVALLGVLYHLENPMGAMRILHELTTSLCVIQSQVTGFDEEISLGYADGTIRSAPASFAVHREADEETALSPLAAMPGVLSLIPNRRAIVEMALAAGFSEAEVIESPEASRHGELEDVVVVARI